MIRISVYITERQIKALRKLSEDNGLKVAEHIRRALDEYLEQKRGTNTSLES